MMNIIKCSQIVGYNDIALITRWGLFKPDGEQIYDSDDRYLQWETWKLDLNTTNIEVETTSNYAIPNVVLEYSPLSNATSYFRVNGTIDCEYLAIVPIEFSPGAEAVLKCTSIYSYNSAAASTKYSIYTIDGEKIYESGSYATDKKWSLDLSDVNIEVGTKFRLKANVIAGSDSCADVILEYDPNSPYTANFELEGNIFKTMFMYTGVARWSILLLDENGYSTEPQVIKCSRIIADNNAWVTTNWQLISTTGDCSF